MKVIEKLIKNNYAGIEFDYSRGRMSILFNKLSKGDIEEVFQSDVKENLLNEHKEKKIKLTLLERRMLECTWPDDIYFSSRRNLMYLKEKGHFKGVIDIDMTIEEIVNNCEIVE